MPRTPPPDEIRLKAIGVTRLKPGQATYTPRIRARKEVLEAVKEEEYVTLAFDLGVSRTSQTVPTGWLSQAVERWAAKCPQPREVRVWPGAVEVPIVWPLG